LQIRKSVTFIFTKEKEKFTPLGTGFFVEYEIEQGKKAIYIITAKHVLQDRRGSFYQDIYLRLNRLDGNAEFIPITVSGYINIIMHDDSTVDIAAFIFSPPTEKYDFKTIPTELFSTKELILKENIHEGTDVFFLGLFATGFGTQINQPVVRFGKVSLMPDEKIEINRNDEPQKLANVYLFECHSIEAFSGAPVFFQLNRLRKLNKIHYGNPELYLAGVMKGHYNDYRISPVLELKDNIFRELNVGIALITPCYYIEEILSSSAAKKERNDLYGI
jgi:hypothetical protein